MDNPFKSPSIIKYCPGFLGLERGLERAVGPTRTIAFVEIEAIIIENLLAGMESGLLDPAPIWANLKTFNAAIRKELANSDCIRHAYGELKKYPTEGRQHALGDIATGCGNVVANTHLNGFVRNNKGGFFGSKKHEIPTTGIEQSGENMGNSNNSGNRTSGNGNNGNGKKKNKGREQQSFNGISGPGKKLGNAESNNERRSRISEGQSVKSTGRSSEELADNNYSGRKEQRKYIATESQQPTVKTNVFNGWPARQGEQQYEWEEPRTSGYINRLPNTLRTMWSKCRKDFAKMLGEEIWQETEFIFKAHFESAMGCTINGYNFREDLLRAYGNSVVEQTAEIAFIDLLRKHSKL